MRPQAAWLAASLLLRLPSRFSAVALHCRFGPSSLLPHAWYTVWMHRNAAWPGMLPGSLSVCGDLVMLLGQLALVLRDASKLGEGGQGHSQHITTSVAGGSSQVTLAHTATTLRDQALVVDVRDSSAHQPPVHVALRYTPPLRCTPCQSCSTSCWSQLLTCCCTASGCVLRRLRPQHGRGPVPACKGCCDACG